MRAEDKAVLEITEASRCPIRPIGPILPILPHLLGGKPTIIVKIHKSNPACPKMKIYKTTIIRSWRMSPVVSRCIEATWARKVM
jgi:hypothetical protein